MTDLKPDTPSGDHVAMQPYWSKVDAVLGGIDVMRTRGEYLPRFPNESKADYDFRLKHAKLTNVFADIVETLSAKPFSKEVTLAGETKPEWAETFIEDVDTSGNHLNVFAGTLFNAGVSDAISWVLVEFTRVNTDRATRAVEAEIGARPYWRHIKADDVLVAYTDMIKGREEFIHVRIKEAETVIEGFSEKTVERVRVLDREKIEGGGYGPATFTVYEKSKNDAGVDTWEQIDQGPLTIGVIALVPFITGRRKGASWRIRPVLQAAIDLQIELFQQESGLKYAKQQTAFPMLTGNGVSPALGPDGKPLPVPVGPKSVLYAPPNGEGDHGEWKFIEPSAESLKFLAEDIRETVAQLRELGRQPLTAQTGNLTVVTTAFAADKANSVIQAWALNLKDCLENCFRFTALWLNQSDEIEVFVDTDFDVNLNDAEGPKTLLATRQAGQLSQRTLWTEFKRRGLLSAEFDPDAEEDLLLNDIQTDI